MSGVTCKYLTAPSEAWTGPELDGPMTRIAKPERHLCSWAQYHPEAVAKLADTPPWLQTAALSGALWNKGDCERCPCFERGEPVE